MMISSTSSTSALKQPGSNSNVTSKAETRIPDFMRQGNDTSLLVKAVR